MERRSSVVRGCAAVISRTLGRRLSKLENRLKPAVEPMTILVTYIDENGEISSTHEVHVCGEASRQEYPEITTGH
jgi:hypothetical protein